ncbi:MAG: cache domain-containing protein, partial [Elusimicrobiota bacterium]
MKLRLLHKFVAVMALVSALPMVLLGLRLISLGQRGVKTAILELHLTVADKISSEFNAYIKSADAGLRSTMNAMAQMDWENKQIMLAALLETRREIKQISVLLKDGSEVMKIISPFDGGGGTLKKYSGAAGFKAARAGGRHLSVDEKTRLAVFYYPFGKDMALRSELDLPSFIDSLDLKRVGSEGFPVVLDTSGIPIAWPGDLPAETAAAAAGWEISKNAVKSLSSGSAEFLDVSGREMLAAYSPIQELGGTVVVSQPREGAYRYAMFMRRQ